MGFLLLGYTIIAAYFATDRGAAVDQYSWERHAKFLRLRNLRAFPLVLDNQFLLESNKSGYPQFFIYLYSLVGSISNFWFGKCLYMLILASIFTLNLGIYENIEANLLIILAICSSPIVISVNRQILPRFIGDLAVATFILRGINGGANPIENWLVCFALCYLVFGIHKMSLQLLIFSVLVVSPITQGVEAINQLSAFSIAGLFYIFIFPGYNFARYQFEEHRNILMFWKTNIDKIGASVFGRQSYGLNNPRRRLRLLILGRLPFVILPALITIICLKLSVKWVNFIPVVSIFGSAEETLMISHYFYILVVIILGSIICTTRRFAHYGSGLFYLTVPYLVGVVSMSILVPEQITALRILSSINILVLSWLIAKNITNRRESQENSEFYEVCNTLNGLAHLERLAVFPYNWSDRLGSLVSDKKILWGAHGCGGWQGLENVFPVMRLTIKELLDKYCLEAIVVHRTEWKSFEDWGDKILYEKFMLLDNNLTSSFRIYIKKEQ